MLSGSTLFIWILVFFYFILILQLSLGEETHQTEITLEVVLQMPPALLLNRLEFLHFANQRWVPYDGLAVDLCGRKEKKKQQKHNNKHKKEDWNVECGMLWYAVVVV